MLVPCGLSLNSNVETSRSENKDIKRFILLFFKKRALMKLTADMQEGAGCTVTPRGGEDTQTHMYLHTITQ